MQLLMVPSLTAFEPGSVLRPGSEMAPGKTRLHFRLQNGRKLHSLSQNKAKWPGAFLKFFKRFSWLRFAPVRLFFCDLHGFILPPLLKGFSLAQLSSAQRSPAQLSSARRAIGGGKNIVTPARSEVPFLLVLPSVPRPEVDSREPEEKFLIF